GTERQRLVDNSGEWYFESQHAVSGEELLSAKFESLDYDTCENSLWAAEDQSRTVWDLRRIELCRWLVHLLIGVVTGAIAFFIDVCIEQLAKVKYRYMKSMLDRCIFHDCLIYALLLWIAFNFIFVLIASCLTVFGEPVAAGSGIPQIKCFLNGIQVPRVVRLRTLVCKVLGVLFSVVGGLAVGKEGPMIHSGSVVGAGLSQGRAASFKFDLGIFEYFRTDAEKRDFVSGGAAAGVAAAFGAPVGLLESGSHLAHLLLLNDVIVHPGLPARLLYRGIPNDLSNPGLISFGKFDKLDYDLLHLAIFACMGVVGGLSGALFNTLNEHLTKFRHRYVTSKLGQLSSFTLAFLLGFYRGIPNDLSNPGLISFGKFDKLDYDLLHLAIFACMGVVGGLSGALFNTLNEHLTKFRHRYVTSKLGQLTEAVLVASITAVTSFVLIYTVRSCQPLGSDQMEYPVQMYCPDGKFSSMAALLFQTPEAAVRSLLHDPVGTYSVTGLIAFCLPYLLIATWTYGVMVPSGLFIPSLLIGAAWGRGVGIGLNLLFPTHFTDPGKFALIGAAAQLGGIVRMTISLSVILIEATGNVLFGLPIMVVLMVAKWVGDYFGTGIYDMHIELASVPLLPWEPPSRSAAVSAQAVMSSPVTCLYRQERVSRIVEVMQQYGNSKLWVRACIVDGCRSPVV
uniref:Chloride channel protein n=1 Tax=Macrostomum lignano TaxID=282301 RepID=A0A1I8J709_9PLAT